MLVMDTERPGILIAVGDAAAADTQMAIPLTLTIAVERTGQGIAFD